MEELNRSETVDAILWLEGIAAEANAEAAKFRGRLEDLSRAELTSGGGAATYRLDAATVATRISRGGVRVSDQDAFTKWAAERYPTEVETVTVVRESWLKAFLKRVKFADGAVADPDTGEVVPGVSVSLGGSFLGVSITPTEMGRQVFAAMAQTGLKRLALEVGPTVPVVLAELEPSDAA